jgi:hypothetical protein
MHAARGCRQVGATLHTGRATESVCDVLGDVFACGILDGELVVDARVQRSIATPFCLVFKLGKPD